MYRLIFVSSLSLSVRFKTNNHRQTCSVCTVHIGMMSSFDMSREIATCIGIGTYMGITIYCFIIFITSFDTYSNYPKAKLDVKTFSLMITCHINQIILKRQQQQFEEWLVCVLLQSDLVNVGVETKLLLFQSTFTLHLSLGKQDIFVLY